MKKEDKKAEKDYKRHVRIYKITQFVLRPAAKLIYGYKPGPMRDLKGPYLVVANHNTNLDPWITSLSLKNHMYFIASEQFYRSGFKSKILKWGFDPIPKIKGASDKLTVMKSLRYLKEGKNVCVFPEGNRSFNGKTGTIEPATGKMVKVSGANLVTFKFEGGYFTFPRWGFGMRKGSFSGGVVNYYTKEQLKEMSVEEVTAAISKDLYENAYETQEKKHIRYKGKNLAVGMECAVCVCPSCKQINTIATEKNSVFCKACGIKTEIDEYGYFGKDFPVHHPQEWDDWQEKFYSEYVASFSDSEKPLFSDDDVGLRTVTADHETKILGTGTLKMYLNKLELVCSDKTLTYPIKNIPDTSVYGKTNFDFTDNEGIHYEFYSDKIINVRKYLSCWKLLRAQLKTEE